MKKIRTITKGTYRQWSAWAFWPASEAGDCCSLGGTAWCLDLGPSSDCLQNLSALKSTHMEETDDIVRCNRGTIDQTSWILMFLSNWTQCTHALNMAWTFINHYHVSPQQESSSTDLQCMCDCHSAGLLWLQADCQTEDRSEGCGRVFPGNGGHRWHCWPWVESGCAAAGQSRLDRTKDRIKFCLKKD